MPGPPGPPGEGPQIPMEALFQVSTTKGPRTRRSAVPDVIEQTIANGKGTAATNTLTGMEDLIMLFHYEIFFQNIIMIYIWIRRVHVP